MFADEELYYYDINTERLKTGFIKFPTFRRNSAQFRKQIIANKNHTVDLLRKLTVIIT